MDISKEIRKISPSNLRELSQILEYGESWKRLMAIIPKTLQHNDYNCDLQIDNLPKYHSEHFRLIENASQRLRKACAEILLDEWGTSGRQRPTFGHLLYLLKKAELYRAADYVAMNILNLVAPERPNEGPAAPVTTTIETNQFQDEFAEKQNNTIEENLNRMETKHAIRKHYNVGVIPKIVITEPTYHRFIVQRVQSTNEEEVSDMIKFSTNSNEIPAFSQILDGHETKESISAQSETNGSELISEMSESVGEIPDFEQLKSNCNETIPNDAFMNHSDVIPQFSALMSTNLPVLSALMKSDGSDISRKSCTSPLPNLSLNTQLNHFNYNELEMGTNNFDETPHKNSLEIENSLEDANNGRFLGCGAYGSVYLALGLLDKPIAVKKLHLKDDQDVQIDDAITKQFRNEVEILSKYKHPNLLSLCGYSCDGPTYCIMYEYISGGALNCRLERFKERLKWKDRLNIALGTSEAVAYLHTAFNTCLIHRDIKTANILLDCSNRPKLCDFGIIKLSGNQNTTVTTTIVGTTVYMAPETFRSGDVSVKTDTFSFGVVLLELLTALPSFDEKRECRDLISHVEEMCDGDAICALLDKSAGLWINDEIDVGKELFTIANRCLEEKRKRPTMVEIRDIIKTLI